MAIENISIEIKSNAKQIANEIADIDNKIKALNNSRADLQVKADSLKAAKEEIAEIELQMKRLRAQKAEIQVDTSQVDDADEKLEDIDKQLRQLRAQKAKLQVDTAELKGADTDLKKLEKTHASLNNKKARLQVDAADIDESESGLSRLMSSLASLGSSNTSVNISSNATKVGNAISGIGDKILSLYSPMSSFIGQWNAAAIAVKAVNSAINLVKNSISGAISRFDTLNNFPKVMENLGISAESANNALDTLNEGLQDLPTALDEATSAVQRFTAKNGDVEKSAEMYLAVNNAILAGGAKATDQANALEQLTQAYSKGTIDANEWKALQVAIPAQLEQVAQSFEMTSDQLYESLQSGETTMEDFMDTFIKLNDEGIEGFASFEEQARSATDGISTSWTNVKNAITRGLEDILTALDTLLEKTSFGSISGFLGTFRNAINDGFASVIEIIEANEDKIVGFIETIQNFNWSGLWQGLKEGFSELKSIAAAAYESLSPIIDLLKSAITSLGDGDFATGLGKIPALLLKIAVAFKAIGTAVKGFGSLSKIFGWFSGSSSGSGSGLSFNFDFGGLLNQAKNLATVYVVIKLIEELAEAMKQINEKVPTNIEQIMVKLAAMGIALGSMSAFVAIAGKLAEHNMTAAVAGLAAVALVSANLMLAAEAMQQINDKVSSDIGNVASKLAGMGIALGGMTALVAVVGVLASSNPVAAIAGLATVAALSLELMLAAEAMQQLDEKVSDDIESTAKKIANIGIAIGAMSGLATIIGALMATGIGALIGAAGLATIALVAADLMLVAEAIQQLNDKVPDDFGEISGKIEVIAEVLKSFTEAGLGNVFDLFSNIVSTLNIAVVTEGIENMISLADALKRFQESLQDFTISDVNPKINAMKTTIELIGSDDGVLGGLRKFAGNLAQNANIDTAITAIDRMIELSEKLKEFHAILQDFTISDVNPQISAMKETIELIGSDDGFFSNLRSYMSNLAENAESETAIAAMDTMITLAEKLQTFGRRLNGFDFSGINEKITAMKETIELIGTQEGFLSNIGSMFSNWAENKETSTAIEALEEMISIANKLRRFSTIMSDVNLEDINPLITEIKDTIALLGSDDGFFASLGNYVTNLVDTSNITTAGTAVASMTTLATNLKLFYEAVEDFTISNVNPKINAMKTTIGIIAGEDGFWSNVATAFAGWAGNAISSNAISAMDTFITLVGKLKDFQKVVEDFTISNINPKISAIKATIGIISGEDGFWSNVAGALAAWAGDEIAEQAVKTIDTIITMGEKLESFPELDVNFDSINGMIESIKEVIDALNDFPAYTGDYSFQTLVESFVALIETLNGLDVEFNYVGLNYAQQLMRGFIDEEVPANLLNVIEAALIELEGVAERFYTVGLNYGERLKAGFKAGIDGMAQLMNIQINLLSTYTTQFRSIGSDYGSALVQAFSSAISSLSSSVSRQVANIQSSLNSLSVPSLNASVGGSVGAATGGLITGNGVIYRAKGGLAGAFKPQGTDTVPAMLTPGEYVQRRAAVKEFGIPFMRKVNNLDAMGAFHELTGRFGDFSQTHRTSVVNNYSQSSTNNAKVTQHIHNGDSNYAFRRANRYLGVRA